MAFDNTSLTNIAKAIFGLISTADAAKTIYLCTALDSTAGTFTVAGGTASLAVTAEKFTVTNGALTNSVALDFTGITPCTLVGAVVADNATAASAVIKNFMPFTTNVTVDTSSDHVVFNAGDFDFAVTN